MVDTAQRVQLFHHFHHDADWALIGSGAMATAMSVNKVHVNKPQRGTPFDWSKMLARNSTRRRGHGRRISKIPNPGVRTKQ
jgi:hypothetical protein